MIRKKDLKLQPLMSLEAVGKILGISREAVLQTEKRALKKLYKILNEKQFKKEDFFG